MVHQNFFKDQRSGVFIDIGAYNGVTFSNSYFFEKELGWTGICIEPVPEIFDQLVKNRSCLCVQGCITDHGGMEKFYKVTSSHPNMNMLSGLVSKYHPTHLALLQLGVGFGYGSLEVIDVQCYLLNDLLQQNNIQHVNLLSIDTEGGEFEILASIDFTKYEIDVILVEDNYNDGRITPFLNEKGFDFVQRIEQDLLFVSWKFLHG